MRVVLGRRKLVANASDRLDHLLEDKLLNDQGIVFVNRQKWHWFIQKESSG